MRYPSIRIEGPILSADIVERIAGGDYPGQAATDFGLEGRVRDEIARAWADARALWGMFSRRRSAPATEDRSGTSRTRSTWVLPLLSLLGYELEYIREAAELRGRKYPVSHRAVNRADLPVHVVGFLEDLDAREARRMSAHSLVQEYLNLADEHLYALVTNGLRLRLLRDASRLVRLSYVEMDLERMMEEELYADFAVLFRLLHASRMPSGPGDAASCILERYHQDALENGERIRGGLSLAVERSIVTLADGFLNEPENTELDRLLSAGEDALLNLHHALLVVIYRILFLLVIEERDLVFADGVDQRKRSIYYEHYSASRLRRLAEIARVEDGRNTDLWVLLRQTFRLFEEDGAGEALGIEPLGGDLFGARSLGPLSDAILRNHSLGACMENLNRFYDAQTRQTIRVNYGALNVEEFGSVYEGLLEKDPVVSRIDGAWRFSFKAGEARASSGSHYTPEELTHPLIRNSLDHVIAARLKEPDPEAALLSIRVCDPACGSGHILLNAARRIGLELARVRTDVEQPAPPDVRRAVRDAIRHCVYGVDKNAHAVELCKVALWLESHDPGEPLGFLDHHVKCGDSVVGVARREELLDGVPEAAFRRQSDDDGTAAALGKRNRAERLSRGQIPLELDELTRDNLDSIQRGIRAVEGMAEHTLVQIEEKRAAYENLVSQTERKRLRELASILVAQSFIPKTQANAELMTTDADYLRYVGGATGAVYDLRADSACRLARERGFFHWFIEFPEVFERGGFDCILGNPPFLGGKRISTVLGERYLHYLQAAYIPARGTCDLVGYFFRRAHSLIRDGGYLGLIATNTIAQGETREGSLEPIAERGGEIVFAVRSMKWPGLAAVSVSLLAIHKGAWTGARVLDGKEVARITPYLDDAEVVGNPYRLRENGGKSFIGSFVLGMGFVLEPSAAQGLIESDPRNGEVLLPYLNGEDLNSRPDQSPSRWVINFHDWSEEKAREYPDCFRIVEEKVKPERTRTDADGKYKLRMPLPDRWWIYADKRPGLYRAVAPLERVMVIAEASKTCAFAFSPTGPVFSHMLVVLALDRDAHLALLQSSFHYHWAWKYSSTLKGDLRYTPSDCFETFPFPPCLRTRAGVAHPPDAAAFEAAGRAYYDHRQSLMRDMQLGLTKTYNLFHDPGVAPGADLSALAARLQKSGATVAADEAATRIQSLRDLHVAMDQAVLASYFWTDLPLGHAFHDVDFLPENDRLRFTVSPAARRELLKRLLELNHRYHAEEEQETVTSPRRGKRRETTEPHPELGL